PAWLAQLDRTIASGLHDGGLWVVVTLVVVQAAVGLAGLVPGAVRVAGAVVGIVASLIFWVIGQSLGELYTGRSTDPNTAPLVVLAALALLSLPAARSHRASSAQLIASTDGGRST
ncbi:MAG: hypothetical protein ACRDPG_06050, partial [Nocardioidaceae bacterium]